MGGRGWCRTWVGPVVSGGWTVNNNNNNNDNDNNNDGNNNNNNNNGNFHSIYPNTYNTKLKPKSMALTRQQGALMTYTGDVKM